MAHDYASINVFFYPETVALIGASGKPGAFSHEMLRNLATRFKGKVYAVNPKYKEILGVPSYPSILDIPDPIDLAVIAVRAQRVPQALEEAGRKGVRGAIIVAGGFAETGEEGKRLQEAIVSIAKRYGVRIVGPNCIGVYNAVNGLDTFFLPPEKMRRPPKGYIAVVSQSGAYLTTMMDWLSSEGVGIVKAINIGNKADVDEAEIIGYYASQEYVRAIMVYMEGVSPGRGRALVEAVRRARDNGKKLVVLKGGKTSYGARAAKSHTAALAGDYAVFSSILREAGAVVAETPTEFVDIAKALSFMGHLEPRGRRVLVVTNAGGPGVLATDELSRRGLALPQTPRDAVEELSKLLPPIVALGNPVDLTGQASDEDYQLVLEKLAGRSEFDSLLVIAPVQPATMTIRVADIIADTVWRVKKPATVMTIGADYGELVKEYLDSRGIPAYPLPDRAAYSLWALMEASKPLCNMAKPSNPPGMAVELVEKALKEGRNKLLEHEALELLEHYEVPVAPYCLAKTPDEASACAEKIASNRLVAKIVSPDIIHKSDVGGVLLGVDPAKAREAYDTVIRRARAHAPDARIVGVLFQAEAPKGVEVIVGSRRDEGFGPIVVYGMGGILVELLRDFSIGLAPTSRCRALEMIRETKSSKLLEGYRGSERKDIDSLAEAITRISRITAEIDSVKEVDVNPIMVYEKGVLAVDARVIIA